MPRQARLDSPGTLHHVIIHGTKKDTEPEFVQLVSSVPNLARYLSQLPVG
jgi:hypothetical protein